LVRIDCRIISEPQEGTRPIYKKSGSKSNHYIVGAGDLDYICGRCDNIIARSVSPGQIASDAVFQCPNCQTFNEVE
jgi:DNA-directed RNA polymerase subunit RPC12/RpoP